MKSKAQFGLALLFPFLLSYAALAFLGLYLYLSADGASLTWAQVDHFGNRNLPYIATALHAVLFFVAYSKLKREGLWVFKRSDILFTSVLALLAIVLIILVLNVLLAFGIGLNVEPESKAQLLFISLITSLSAGFGEEFYFRAYLFKLGAGIRPWVLIILSSLSFAIWHPDWQWFLHTFLVGLLFAWAFKRKGRILPIVIAHVLTDMALGLMAYANS